MTEDAQSIIANYQDFAGKECTEVVTDLVTKIGQEGYLSKDTQAVTIASTEPPDSTTVPTIPDGNTQEPTTPPSSSGDNTQEPTAPPSASGDNTQEPTAPPASSGDNTQEPTAPPVTEPGHPVNIPASAQKQPDGTYILTEALDAYGNPADGQSEPVYILTTAYDPDGVKISQTNCYANGVKFFYQEFYPTGNPKNYKRWNDNGMLIQEFVAFHGEDSNNGIIKFYDEQGNLQGLDTFGNPNGSADTSEWWDADGSHSVTTIVDGQPVEATHTYPDGGVLTEIFNYEANTVRVVAQRPQYTCDMISSMETGEFIDGYHESTNNGIYQRLEYVDGYKCKQITDGAKNPLGYKYKETTCYYSNGQTKTSERYFYADGGRTYVEYDEHGNTTYWEDTTECNYGVVGS